MHGVTPIPAVEWHSPNFEGLTCGFVCGTMGTIGSLWVEVMEPHDGGAGFSGLQRGLAGGS